MKQPIGPLCDRVRVRRGHTRHAERNLDAQLPLRGVEHIQVGVAPSPQVEATGMNPEHRIVFGSVGQIGE